MKNLITCVLCNWKSPDLLVICVEALKKSFTVDTDIKVVLNEYDKSSVEYLADNHIDFVATKTNQGAVGIDLITPLLDSEFVVSLNDDQLSPPSEIGWQDNLLNLYGEFHPCVPCGLCVEPEFTSNPMVEVDDLGHILDTETYTKFADNCISHKYNRTNKLGYNHPNLVRTEDWKKVGGYSCGLDKSVFGVAGYQGDDWFYYNLWNLYQKKLKFIVDGKTPFYHQVSYTGKRLPSEIKNFDSHSRFVELTGMSTQQFRSVIGWGTEI